MAIVILGGLATSSLTNLFVLPALYLRFGHSRKPPKTREGSRDDDAGAGPGGGHDAAGSEAQPLQVPLHA
jgi:predicted RND superfamily exporter protein